MSLSAVALTILLENISPHDNLQAVVEEDGGAVYFYLWGGDNSSFGMKSCWVRNLKAAPKKFAVTKNKPPLLPQEFCKHAKGEEPLDASALQVVWLQEGDGAALLEGDEILAIIPSWSGQDGFHGYARDCIGESPVAWELTADNAMIPRVTQAANFWSSWQQSDSCWREVQQSSLKSIDAAVGTYDKYFAIDGGMWPPKAIVQVPISGGTCLVSLGISIRPQPAVEMYFEDPSPYRRIELAMAVGKAFAPDQVSEIGAYISGQSRFPWDRFSWLGPGHTIGCDLFVGFAAVILWKDPPGAPQIAFPAVDGDPVNVLWLVPITDSELSYAMENGSEALFAKLSAAGCSWIFTRRNSVV